MVKKILLKTYRFLTYIYLRLLLVGLCLSANDFFIRRLDFGLEALKVILIVILFFVISSYYYLKTKTIFIQMSKGGFNSNTFGFFFDKITGVCNLIIGLILTSIGVFFIFESLSSIDFKDFRIYIALLFLFYGILKIYYTIWTLKVLFNSNQNINSIIDDNHQEILEKDKKSLDLKKVIKRVLQIQLLIFFSIILLDLYVFRGLYTSKIYINPKDSWENEETYSCDFLIEKKANNNYLFSFRNKSLFPKYFMNYRFGRYFPKVTDTFFFQGARENIFPDFDVSYGYGFDCGTGLGLTSINPAEKFEIEKTYKQLVNELSYLYNFKRTKVLYRQYDNYNREQLDSLLIAKSKLISKTDSIEVEYYIAMNSFLSKSHVYTKSNKIKISLKDLIDRYLIKRENDFY